MDMRVVARSRESVRMELVERVRARRPELEQAILARIGELAASLAGEEDAGYVVGLRAAVVAAVEHGLAGIEHGLAGGERGRERMGAAPPEAIAQVRRAARASVSLDTVLRRYMLGSTVVGDFLMQEAERVDFPGKGALLREMLADQAGVLNRLMSAITEEYTRELSHAESLPEQRRVERVRKLLAGECREAQELGSYRLEDWHLGAIASGGGSAAAARALERVAARLEVGLLQIPWGRDAAWGWLGGARPVEPGEVQRALGGVGDAQVAAGQCLLALGEPGRGYEGWRTTHQQAQAALAVALRSQRAVTRYADVALIAAVLRDDALASSLVEIFLTPLGDRRNGGGELRETLRAYLAAQCNASSAASALGVGRHTVQRRLRAIEERLGQRLRTHQAELGVALRLEALGLLQESAVDVARPDAGQPTG
ncbi:MAG: helix-turn-helix domain-containing protein [Solirubrobacteraceae bacterium]